MTVESEYLEWPPNSQSPLPRQQYLGSAQGSRATALPRGYSSFATALETSQVSSPTTNRPVKTPTMSQRQSTTNSWGAWGQTGPRPPFDAGAYGNPRRSKTVQSKSTTSQAQAHPQINATHTPASTQTPQAGLGDGLAQPISHLIPHGKGGVATVHPETHARRTSGKLGQRANSPKRLADCPTATRSHNNKPTSAQDRCPVTSSELDLQLKIDIERGKSPGPRAKTSAQSSVPWWGEAATEPTKSVTRASEPHPFTLSEARANPRTDRPSMQHYQQQRSGIDKNNTRVKSAVPEVEAMNEAFERAKMEIHNDSGQRRLQKNQKKYDTTDLATLHEIRRAMPAKTESACEIKIQHYQKLGESPANWPESTSDIEPGNASEAFARSRDEIRAQALRAKEDKQARDWAEKNQKGYNIAGEELSTRRQPQPRNSKRNTKWVTPDEVRAQVRKPGSNDFGSAHPDEATPSEGSLQAVHNGEDGRRVQDGPDPGLIGWDGKLVEAPADWESRPKAHAQRYRPEQGDFGQFLSECFHQQYPQESFAALPEELVMDTSLHADGISMAPRAQTVTLHNPASHLGYSDTVLLEVSQLLHNFPDSQFLTGTTEAEFNFVEPASAQAMDEIGYIETSEIYAQRYMAMRTRQHKPLQHKQEPSALPAAADPIEKGSWNKKPDISIHLRPAAKDDLPQLAEIYNWHVENGPRPTEMGVISEGEMRDRFEDATNSKLPLIVAVANFKTKKRNHGSNRNSHAANGHPVQNVDPSYQGIVAKEKIVGWASATDWSASDYVERISAELEVYVDPEHRMNGVGGCLMDKMLQICDRGYIPRNACAFSCLPEHSYMYNNGGARDLHKIWFIMRNWSKPVKTPEDQKVVKAFDREDEVDIWLKSWLESMGFAQEGHLRQIGARNGRLLVPPSVFLYLC